MSEYFHHAGSSLTGDVYGLDFQRSTSIHSEHNLELTGPLDVAGTIKARNITFDGDFIVSDAIDAYGDMEINGNMTAEGRIKAFGDVKLKGTLTASGKIGAARLKLRGTIHAAEIEIFGNLVIRGYLNCRRLTVYGSVILVGPNSKYDVSGYEMVTGLRTRRDHEPDFDV
ncbi:hypothetical protein NLG97_g3078 [Lecanicillium saksenae]|uniref:Uncharacterized protein n=1 Tax=Lecanicillium saksenae TaxID=468837 RepID=A0ACC1R0D5_9HYPO|nr:hypothetical protein NLG97_g3078 [Lecanicillium saksenae]